MNRCKSKVACIGDNLKNIKGQYSRLGLLMNTLGISGSELAASLHVDSSLVSKWRNNHRTISHNSPYLQDIAGILIDKEAKAELDVIANLLRVFDPGVDLSDPENTIDCLCRWLTSLTPSDINLQTAVVSPNLQGAYDSAVRIWQGSSGRRDAVLFFLQKVLAMPAPQQLYLVSQDNISWMLAKPAFLQQWQSYLLEILKQGHKITIIHWVDRSINRIESILEYWLPLHLTGQINAWFSPVYTDLSYFLTLFLVKNAMALTGVTTKEMDDSTICTTYSNDPISLAQYEAVFEGLLKECRPLIKIYSTDKLIEVIDQTFTDLDVLENSYCFSHSLQFSTMSAELLRDILQTNKVKNATINRILKYHENITKARKLSRSEQKTRYVVEKDRLLRYGLDKPVVDFELSLFAGKSVVLDLKHQLQHLKDTIKYLQESKNGELGITNSLINQKVPINLWIRENNSVVAWSELPELAYTAYALEPTVVRAFYTHFDAKWQEIPRVMRIKDEVIGYLQSLVAKAKKYDN